MIKQTKKWRWAALVLIMALIMPYLTINVKADTIHLRAAASEAEALCFDAIYYAEQNGDLKFSYGYDEEKLYEHWIKYGIEEGRPSSPVWHPKYYLDHNPDVKSIYGTDYEGAYRHFLADGQKEYRISSPYYYGIFYKARYEGEFRLYDSFGLLKHFKYWGLNEGRTAYTARYEGRSGWRITFPVPDDIYKEPASTPAPTPTPTPTPTPAPSPVLEVSPSNMSAAADGTIAGTAAVQVNTNAGSSQYEASSSTGGFRVSTNGSSWLSVGKSSSNYGASSSLSYTGQGSFYVFAQPNNTSYSRTGTITVTHEGGTLSRSVTVTQEGKKSAQLTVSSSQLNASADGTMNTSYITANTGSTGGFRVNTGSSSWLKVGKNSSKYSAASSVSYTDSGSFYVFADPNTSESSRTGYITVTHEDGSVSRTVAVKQEGKEKPAAVNKPKLSVDTNRLSVAADGTGSSARSVRADTLNTGGFKAEVSSADRSWLSISRQGTGSGSSKLTYSGSGTVYVTVSANTAAKKRTGTITITHADNSSLAETIQIVQSAKSGSTQDTPGSDKPVNGTGSNKPADGTGSNKPADGTGSDKPVDGTGNGRPIGGTTGDKPVDGTGSNKPVDGTGSNKPADGTGSSRPIEGSTGNTDSSQDSNYVQKDGDVISADVSEITANANGVLSVSSVRVDTEGTGGFTADTKDNDWIKVGKSEKKSGASTKVSYNKSGTFYVFADKYAGKSKRTGTITIKHEKGKLQTEIKVEQSASGAVFSVDTEKKTVDKDGSFYNNAVSVKAGKSAAYTVEVQDCDWLGITSEETDDFDMGLLKMSFTGSQTFYLVAAQNTGNKRTAVITVTQESDSRPKEITVTQIGMDSAYMEIDRETAYFDEPGAAVSGAVHVLADEDTKWTAQASEKWIKIAETASSSAEKYASMEGTGSGTFYIHVDKNDALKERSGLVTVSAPGMESYEIYVSQAENERDIEVLLEELTVSVTKKTFKKGKTSQIKFSFPEGLYASDVKKVSYKSSKKKVVTVDKNGKVKALRKGKAVITVKVELDSGAVKKFNLKVNVGTRTVKVTKKK